MYKINNKVIHLDRAFEHNGIQYPANWLRMSTKEDKEQLGIVEIPQETTFDNRFYYARDIPKPLNEVKEYFIDNINQQTFNILNQTDWLVVKSIEIGSEIPKDVSDYRNKIREYSTSIKNKISKCKSIPKLIEIIHSSQWPELTK